tara:strand:- start:91 stop:738 length:648 start_codon:yes stop_codon:yes gene_type:complete
MKQTLIGIAFVVLSGIFFSPVLAQEFECPHPWDPMTYEEIRKQAIHHCRNKSSEKINIAIIDLLISIEKEFDIPFEMRGMLLSAACHESGYNPNAKGDYRLTSTGKKRPKAIGILQFWPWAEKKKAIDRNDPAASARFWMQRIIERVPKAKKFCRFRNEKRQWLAAWVTAIRAPKEGGRCYEFPNHYRTLKKWHKNIRRIREECREEEYYGECDC